MSEILTPQSDFVKLFASNQTTAGTTVGAGVPTLTPPNPTEADPNGYFSMSRYGGRGLYSNIALIFAGTDTANQTGIAKVNGWRRVGYSSTAIWVPIPLMLATFTLGTALGAPGSLITDDDLIADTIVATTAFTSAYESISPADNSVAMLSIDAKGCDFVQVQLRRNASSASLNAFAAGF